MIPIPCDGRRGDDQVAKQVQNLGIGNNSETNQRNSDLPVKGNRALSHCHADGISVGARRQYRHQVGVFNVIMSPRLPSEFVQSSRSWIIKLESESLLVTVSGPRNGLYYTLSHRSEFLRQRTPLLL